MGDAEIRTVELFQLLCSELRAVKETEVTETREFGKDRIEMLGCEPFRPRKVERGECGQAANGIDEGEIKVEHLAQGEALQSGGEGVQGFAPHATAGDGQVSEK